jgi:hypothetical protein
MTVYSRSDQVSVNVGPAHGGCGTPHFRPVVDGEPVRIWALTCDQCEDFLRSDPHPPGSPPCSPSGICAHRHWSSTAIEIPETYDEKVARERNEKTGKMDMDRQMAEALISLGPLGQLPQALAQLLQPLLAATAQPAALAGQLECPSGHAQAPGAKFCNECGAAMHGVPAQSAIAAPQKPAKPAKGQGHAKSQGPLPRIRDARHDEQQALCRAHGLDDTGTRSDLIARLARAGVTNRDLAALREQPAAA